MTATPATPPTQQRAGKGTTKFRPNLRYPGPSHRAAVRSLSLVPAIEIAPFLPAQLRLDIRDMAVAYMAGAFWPECSRWGQAVALAQCLRTASETPIEPALAVWVARALTLNGGKPLGAQTIFKVLAGKPRA